MKKAQIRVFEEPGIVACALLAGGEDYMEIGEQGLLAVPSGVEPKGFHLVVAVKKDGRTFMVQKNVGLEGGSYHRHALSEVENFAMGFRAMVMRDPIEVVRAGSSVWTSWHQDRSNRVDCWCVGKDGKLGLFQVGIFTHDNGKTWKLHGEYRWRGQMYGAGDKIVAKPEHPKWGSLEGGTSKRTQIFQHPEFVALMKGVELPAWNRSDLELDPPLPEPGANEAVMQWYIVFAGQTGQGPAYLVDGHNAWVHGTDIVGVKPDPDGETRLWRGDIVSFTGTAKFGSKPNGPPKLTGVRLVKRDW